MLSSFHVYHTQDIPVRVGTLEVEETWGPLRPTTYTCGTPPYIQPLDEENSHKRDTLLLSNEGQFSPSR